MKQQRCYNCFQIVEASSTPCPHCGFDPAENREKFPVALPMGTVLNDRYIIGRVLGQGGFGITYLALDTQLDAKVAIKEFLPSELATREGTTVSVYAGTRTEEFDYGAERFQEEARTLAKFIGNPNIAGVSSYFDENGTSYFVMDYIEGISFKSYIAQHGGQISVEETMNVMIPVLRALTAVHAEGFIHRDVTPDNIYITKSGDVKLLDFGSARYSIGDKSKSLDVILKVGYAPKEQYIRRSRQGPYTDVYSCAACCYAAITGYLPPEALERMEQDELTPISQLGIEIPPYLENAILKGLAVQPEDRFQSAAGFLDAIESQQVVEVPVSGRNTVQPSAAPDKTKPKAAIIGIVAALLALVLGVGFLGGGDGDGDHRPLKKSAVASITIDGEEFSTDLRRLDLRDRNLTDADIQDLKYMINLDYLNLRGNDLTDLSPLEPLTELVTLQLDDGSNGVTDLSPLAGMTKLDWLSLPKKMVDVDLSPLSGMTELTGLCFDGHGGNMIGCVSDLEWVSSLTKLQELRLSVNGLEDLSPLANLKDLNVLTFEGHIGAIQDFSPLSGLTKLKEFSVYNNGSAPSGMNLRDLSDFAGLTSLKTLRLAVNDLESLHGLENLTNLEELSIYGDDARITSTAPLAALTGLRSLDLPYSRYYQDDPFQLDLSGLSGMTELRDLRIAAPLGDLTPLEHLTALQSLELADTSYGQERGALDITPLAGLTGVSELRLAVNRSADLDTVGRMTGLRSIDLNMGSWDRPIRDLSPLAALPKLSSAKLWLSNSNNDELDTSPLSHIPNLEIHD